MMSGASPLGSRLAQGTQILEKARGSVYRFTYLKRDECIRFKQKVVPSIGGFMIHMMRGLSYLKTLFYGSLAVCLNQIVNVKPYTKIYIQNLKCFHTKMYVLFSTRRYMDSFEWCTWSSCKFSPIYAENAGRMRAQFP